LRVPPTEVPIPATEVPAPAAEVPAPAEIGDESIDEPRVEPSADPHVEVAETAEIVATAGRGDSRTPDAAGMATTADSDGDPRPAADVGGIEAPECEVPPWADRPTAGFPTVPVAVGLHPTWVAVPPEPASGPRPIGETSTVGVTGNSLADLSVTHSRATFGRMRRFGHPRQRKRPSTTDCNNKS
jgi:hypothetical protein